MGKHDVLILLGSDSDLPVVKDALDFFKGMDVSFKIDISSAHRNPEKTMVYAKNARNEGFRVIIAVAGMAAHLPGVIASHTTLPVIGVPSGSGSLNGLDALLSIVSMPKGIPVATVGINAARNAAILACEILSIKDENIGEKLEKMKEELRQQNDESAIRIEQYLQDL
ncbi:MAG TPA: 5-(carboxyamino)imidazole ribonucleotide mutase [Syntrophorhabdaceae bacterium]|jgi:5-(carboxyamino)imidazole ribonucleotide mutase|nr:5-(carboxyamino)imidazole ribonucleotide mutase [Syntrophorhabdaceae bacterium]MDI9561047.1 5-(carboxyamino)imidazole ribonucleotide mutase [Pseudomonadota bacterium]OQC47304.1 MAG: N5-carboxyaminoimidazole ribonucleotide mutase [Deltaproteobacteria bacterium ADurb.Bin026]MBP8698879.1 5-(carboxyamino)imidazole ribonucleotide mutase [Syntrophorhabdaceae bacterium]MBV6506405.1 N5-carboxyaminoimidazole ribonucleotide mutase [Syntrophorhabdaceae bacterium]